MLDTYYRSEFREKQKLPVKCPLVWFEGGQEKSPKVLKKMSLRMFVFLRRKPRNLKQQFFLAEPHCFIWINDVCGCKAHIEQISANRGNCAHLCFLGI